MISHGPVKSSETAISDSLEIGKLGSDEFSFYNYVAFPSGNTVVFFSSMIQDSLKGNYVIDDKKNTLEITNVSGRSESLTMGIWHNSPDDMTIDYPDIKYAYFYSSLGAMPYSRTFKTVASRDSLVALLQSPVLPDNVDSIVYTVNMYSYKKL